VAEFKLDTSGAVDLEPPGPPRPGCIQTVWGDLDALTQGYIEALFFTESESLSHSQQEADPDASAWVHKGFSDLDPESLVSIIADCAKFQASPAWVACRAAWSAMTDHESRLAGFARGGGGVDDRVAGHDFWYTRTGAGCGFWDGDWPEPHATALDEAAKTFGGRDVCLGDDGKVYA